MKIKELRIEKKDLISFFLRSFFLSMSSNKFCDNRN